MTNETRGLRGMARTHPLSTFFALAIGLAWIVALPLILSPAGLGVIQVNVPELWAIFITATPTVAALWTQRLESGSFRISRLGSPWPRVVGGGLGGVAMVLVAYVVVPALLLTGGAATSLHWGAIIGASAGYWINPINLLGGPLTEEFGWRGFALPRLQDRYGALKGTLLLSAFWLLWHLPLLLVHGWLSTPAWSFAILITCLSVLMTFAVNLSRGGIVTAVLMHAMFNSNFPILVGMVEGLPTKEPGLFYYVIGASLTALIVILVTRGRLGSLSAGAGRTRPLLSEPVASAD